MESEHLAAIVEPARTGALLRAIELYPGEPLTRLALKPMPRSSLSAPYRFKPRQQKRCEQSSLCAQSVKSSDA